MATFSDLSNKLPVVINQYQEPFYNKTLRESPIMNLVPRREFKNSDGLNPVVVTTTAELPTSYPSGLTNLSLSNGSGSAACDVSGTLIHHGYTSRTYALEVAAFESEVLCATDLDFGPNGVEGTAQVIANYIKNMQSYLKTFWTDWYRIKNLASINNKVTVGLLGAFADVESNTNASFTGMSVPTDVLKWNHLDALWDLAQQTGMSEQSPTMSGGQPAFFLVTGTNAKRRLFQYDTLTRDTVNWQTGVAAFENFKAMGIDTTINGFVPIVDPYAIRYGVDAVTPIYPFTNENTTTGRRWIPNPNYQSVAKGGLAVYEVFHILSNNIWEARPRSTGLGAMSGASFNPINYTGELNWINNKDTTNPLGNKGYFRADVQVAAKPIFPEYGYSGLALIDAPST